MAGKPGNRFAHMSRGTQKAPGHMQPWGSIHVKTQPAKKMPLAATARFSHPDYTVGSGITPDQPPKGSSRTLPPVGNHTLPRRLHALLVLIIADFSGLDKWFFLQFTRQAPELISHTAAPGSIHLVKIIIWCKPGSGLTAPLNQFQSFLQLHGNHFRCLAFPEFPAALLNNLLDLPCRSL